MEKMGFCQRNQGDANFWVGLYNYVITAVLYWRLHATELWAQEGLQASDLVAPLFCSLSRQELWPVDR